MFLTLFFGVAFLLYLQDWSTTVQVNVGAVKTDSDNLLTLSMKFF